MKTSLVIAFILAVASPAAVALGRQFGYGIPGWLTGGIAFAAGSLIGAILITIVNWLSREDLSDDEMDGDGIATEALGRRV